MLIKSNRKSVVRVWQESYAHDACGDLVLTMKSPATTRILLADVSGHDAESARIARTLRFILEDDLTGPMSESIIMNWNERLIQELPAGQFVAATVVELQHETNEAVIWNSGNPAVACLQPTFGQVFLIEEFGFPLGLLDTDRFVPPAPYHISLQSNDTLMFFSDGLIEQRRGCTLLGWPAIQGALLDAMAMALDPLQQLQETIAGFLGPEHLSDDLTVVYIDRENQDVEIGARLLAA